MLPKETRQSNNQCTSHVDSIKLKDILSLTILHTVHIHVHTVLLHLSDTNIRLEVKRDNAYVRLSNHLAESRRGRWVRVRVRVSFTRRRMRVRVFTFSAWRRRTMRPVFSSWWGRGRTMRPVSSSGRRWKWSMRTVVGEWESTTTWRTSVSTSSMVMFLIL
ncbi:hypothetical protein BCR39DRAFT_257350 [Naematelia encephala]|uniref:Uncharacterized protein n=1 Tax=Naematelia encephala TaxID=71784 RepID=A0A1Y2AW47_9TREE|nr:hypothetical protein BCR39DRAFT_257350 [Naematelia encephala]